MTFRSILLLFAVLAAIPITNAHFNLKDPMPYNRVSCKMCKGPCPPIRKSGNQKARNTPKNPSRVWKRGQVVNIEWHRNNHEGGFYRRALVPIKYMNDKSWHKKLAFEWGCWNQNRYQCGKSPDCGSDKKGNAYRNTMTVPKVFPDGDYVFSMVWYGGTINFNLPHFSDYYACAYVRIQGGDFASEYTPKFVRGTTIRKVAPGKCSSASSFIGECGGGPCTKNPVRDILPGEFQNGGSPLKVYRSFLDGKAGTSLTTQASPDSQEKKAIVQSNEDSVKDAKMTMGEGETSKNMQEKKFQGPCSAGSIPPRPRGKWGKKYSGRWRRQNAIQRKRRNYCRNHKCNC